MKDVSFGAFTDKCDEVADFLEYVNTDVMYKMKFNDEVYAAYAAANGLSVDHLPEWYQHAEHQFITSMYPAVFIAMKYNVWEDEDIEHYALKEIESGDIYEVAGYWFKRD